MKKKRKPSKNQPAAHPQTQPSNIPSKGLGQLLKEAIIKGAMSSLMQEVVKMMKEWWLQS